MKKLIFLVPLILLASCVPGNKTVVENPNQQEQVPTSNLEKGKDTPTETSQTNAGESEETEKDDIGDTYSSNFVSNTQIDIYHLPDGGTVRAGKDEVMVYLKEDVTLKEYQTVTQYIENTGAKILAFVRDLRTLQVQVKPDVSELDFIEQVKKIDGVNGAALNEVVRMD